MSVILGLKLLLSKGSTRTISHSLLIDFLFKTKFAISIPIVFTLTTLIILLVNCVNYI